jgi:hypothetical protein
VGVWRLVAITASWVPLEEGWWSSRLGRDWIDDQLLLAAERLGGEVVGTELRPVLRGAFAGARYEVVRVRGRSVDTGRPMAPDLDYTVRYTWIRDPACHTIMIRRGLVPSKLGLRVASRLPALRSWAVRKAARPYRIRPERSGDLLNGTQHRLLAEAFDRHEDLIITSSELRLTAPVRSAGNITGTIRDLAHLAFQLADARP